MLLLDPAVYPLFNIYPSRQLAVAPRPLVQTEVVVRLAASLSGYPESVYEIYPDMTKLSGSTSTVGSGLTIQLPSLYPMFSIYPSVYPYNVYEIYPPVSIVGEEGVVVRNFATYPAFVLCKCAHYLC
jgi:hypothetical protein